MASVTEVIAFLQTLSVEDRLKLIREMESKNIFIGVKPPQSGKTKQFIITPTLDNIQNGVLTIIIVPSRISLEKQTADRFIQETNEDEDDDSFYTADDLESINDIQKQFYKNTKNIKERHIGRFDTGIPKSQRLDNPKNTIERFRNGDIRLLIVLDNSQGIKKLCSLLSYIDKKLPEQKINIICDEVHGFLNLTPIDEDSLDVLNHTIDTTYQRSEIVAPSLFYYKKNTNIMWIMENIRKNKNWKFDGTTATVAPLLICKNNYPGFNIRTVDGSIPECYIGYSKITKKYYRGYIENAFLRILTIRSEFACVMFHSGRTNESHMEAGYSWINMCLEEDIDESNISFMTDNQNGYSVFGFDKQLVKNFSKKEIDEPWKAVEWMQKRYTHSGIFGDISMAESNTYQKCNQEYNVPITDLIVKPLGRTPMKKMTSVIQKVGRIYTNDTINNNMNRIIWFFKDSKLGLNDRKIFEDSLKIESCIQRQSKDKNLTTLDYKQISKNVKNNMVDDDGELIPCEVGMIDYSTILKRFRGYKTAETKVAKFIKSIKSEAVYSKDEILEILKECGYSKPDFILNSYIVGNITSKDIKILNVDEDNNYSIDNKYAKAHMEVFS